VWGRAGGNNLSTRYERASDTREKLFNSPYKGLYIKEEARYGVTGSSLRVNLGAGFTDLFTDEGSRIIATFKVSKDGKLGLFYKRTCNLFTVYVRNQLNMLRGMLLL
jgi:hypothetical protein